MWNEGTAAGAHKRQKKGVVFRFFRSINGEKSGFGTVFEVSGAF